MNTARWQQIKELFERVVDLPAGQRELVLANTCADDTALRQAVERRLRADAEAEALSFLEEPVEQAPTMSIAEERAQRLSPPQRLGPYRIMHQIGSGGMGTVYAAERDDEAFRRLVAIKVINARARDDEELPRRLRAERQILALLEHPNIARIYDGGTTEDGTPYLVMEHVEGEPIDHYCTRNGLSIDQRVALLRKVCSAVQYAHRNLVVHRDLKPSNILVTAEGEPKLLDFGIAKVLDPVRREGDEVIETTAPWHRPLSLNYASPEQIRGETISTASDVYSLGVLLFLLLTGSLPRSFSGLSPWQVERHLSTTEPPRPSAKVSENATADGLQMAERRRIARLLRRDLDAIVVKALRSDREARYGSAEQLGRDLDHYLGGLPVTARRGTWRYRAGKFLRRHRLAAASSAAALLLGLTLLASLAIAAANAARGQARLQAEQTKLQEMLGFFLGMFEYAGPYAAEGVDLTLRQAVDRQAERFAGALEDQPEVQATVLSTLGWIYLDLGAVERSLAFHQQALALRRQRLGGDALDVAESLDGVAAALRDQWELDEAAAMNAEALALYRRHPAANRRLLLRSLNNRVKLLCLRRDWQAADPLSAEALALGRTGFDEREPEASKALLQRALVLGQLGDPEGAHALYVETLADYERRYGATHPILAPLYNNLGQLEAKAGRYHQAVDYLRQADHQFASSFGDDFYNRIPALTNLGRHLQQLDDLEGAEEALRSALDVAVRSPGVGPESEIGYFGRPALALGTLLEESGQCAEAIALLSGKLEAWEQRLASLKPGSPTARVVQDSRALIERCSASRN